jgi:hypothetical protein
LKVFPKTFRDANEALDVLAKANAMAEAYERENMLEFITTAPRPGFNPKQYPIVEAFLDPFYKTFGMSGGNRLGKTFLLTCLGLSVVFGKYLWDGTNLLHLFPHNKARKVRYVGQGWHDHVLAVVIPQIEALWPKNRKFETHGNGVITGTFWKDVKTGSTIEIMSNNQRSKEHEGWEGDLILYDEPCRREIYVANARGLVDRNGREVFACTLLDEPWIDRDIIKRLGANGKADRRVFWIEGNTYDNVGYGITKEGADEYSDKLDDEERQSRIDGVPSYKSGLIYGQWKRNIHLKERFEVPLDWIVDIAIDTHPRENQAVLFVATGPDQRRYVIDEIWENGDGTWVGEQVIRRINSNSYRVGKIICDPLAKGDQNNDNTTFDKIDKVLYRYGYVLHTATKDKSSGIKEVKLHLKGPNNEPSLFVFDDCLRFIYEVEGYMWEMKDGKPTGKPSDKDDHMMENLYRALLENTVWFPMEEEEEDDDRRAISSTRNRWTGY